MGFALNYDLGQDFFREYEVIDVRSDMVFGRDPTITLKIALPGYIRLLENIGVRFKRTPNQEDKDGSPLVVESSISYDEFCLGAKSKNTLSERL